MIARALPLVIRFAAVLAVGGCGGGAVRGGDAGAPTREDLAAAAATGDMAGGGLGDGAPAGDLATIQCPDDPFSTFAEVSLRFTGGKCRFTLAQAAAGIQIPYQLVVTRDVRGVIPEPGDGSRCGRPEQSGLIPMPFG